MAARANYVKLGLFVVIGLAAAIALAAIAGALALRRETVSYLTYFAESVDGLEVDAPVKIRGVRVGRVGKIAFAPDGELVEVRIDFDVATLKTFGFFGKAPPPGARAQLTGQGLVSGSRSIALDTFDPKTHPAPVLTFETPENYIPSTPSVAKSLETSILQTLDRLARLADQLVQEGVAEKTARAIADADSLVTTLDRTLQQVDQQRLPARTAKALEAARTTLGTLNQALQHVDGDGGLVASAQRAATAVGEVGRNASSATHDLRDLLDEVRAAVAAVRELAEQIEQQPDMLLKGRRKS
jgi:ABC-type transporter Mla subunit MlaD